MISGFFIMSVLDDADTDICMPINDWGEIHEKLMKVIQDDLNPHICVKAPHNVATKDVIIKKDATDDGDKYSITVGDKVLVKLIYAASQRTLYLLDYAVQELGFVKFADILSSFGLARATFTLTQSTLDHLNASLIKHHNTPSGWKVVDLTNNVFCGRINQTEENSRAKLICKQANMDLIDFIKSSRCQREVICKLVSMNVFNLELLTMHNNYGFSQASYRVPSKLCKAIHSSAEPDAFTIGRDTLYDDDSLSKGGYVLCATKRFAAIASGELAYLTFKSLKAEAYTPALWQQWLSSGEHELWTAMSTFPLMYCAACPTAVIREANNPRRFKLLSPWDIAKLIADINNEGDFDFSNVAIAKPTIPNFEDFDL